MQVDRSFWLRYLGIAGAADEDEHPARRWVLRAAPDGVALVVDISDGAAEASVELVAPGVPPCKIAWKSPADGVAHVLRWYEVEVLARALALRGELPHPGPVAVLLSELAPLCQGDPADAIVPTLDDALYQCGLDEERADVLTRFDRRCAEIRWARDGQDWVVEQAPGAANRCGIALYTLRSSGSDGFPHGVLAQLVAEAEQACAAAIDPGWRTPRVLELARTFADGDPDAAPVLATELRAVGCAHPVVLDALAEPVDPNRAAWVLELVAGAPCGSIVASHFGPTTWENQPRYAITIHVPVDTVGWDLQASGVLQPVMYASPPGPARGPMRVITWAYVATGGVVTTHVDELEATLRANLAPDGVEICWYEGDELRRRRLERRVALS